MKTCATLFSGGGLADIGLKQAGYTPLWAVEYDAAIADVYARNHGPHVIVGDVRAVEFGALPAPDFLWASPPCPNFSVAKTGRGETEGDLEIADAVARALTTLRPRLFVLENVEGYAQSKSYQRVRAALDALDYWSDAEVVNAADVGVPQTRRRLILRARAGGWMQPSRPWPRPVAWQGWYAAIADLVPGLPDSQFAPWQLKRLPVEMRESVLVEGAGNRFAMEGGGTVTQRGVDDPAHTIRAASYKHLPRALLVSNSKTEYSDVTREAVAPALATTAQHGGRLRALLYSNAATMDERAALEPAVTVTGTTHAKAAMPKEWLTQLQPGARGDWREGHEPAKTLQAGDAAHQHNIALPSGRVVSMTPRALARFMGVPDTYWLPERKSLACRVLGNGVCPAVARVAAETLEAP